MDRYNCNIRRNKGIQIKKFFAQVKCCTCTVYLFFTMSSKLCKLLSCLRAPIPVLMVIGSSFITLTNGYDCDQFCNKDCKDYSQTFGDCLSANLHCDCSSPTNISKLVLLAVVLLFCTTMCCGVCFQICRNRRRGATLNRCFDILAEPAVVIDETNNSGGDVTNETSNGFVTASPIPQKPSVSPPPEEYLQPPPYNECKIASNLPPQEF
ncbi:hypothetical protein Ocin01_11452 [Orchesella cincta]|uniref:Uncharacterized protein n=1 Tax=Orchesella cincta TaxID=48709 RepID=A0A1D2MQS9_ORCCI|nr:hypothetical protein Ocin01_11452 [Orchesella cincta]